MYIREGGRGKKLKIYMVVKNNLSETFWIPKELVDVVVTNNLGVILFLSYKFTVQDFITLIAHKTVEGFDDSFKVETLANWFDPVLTFWTAIVVICTFENETKTLWDKADVSSLAPAQEVECNLTKAIIVAHVVHGVSPAVKSGIERFCTS